MLAAAVGECADSLAYEPWLWRGQYTERRGGDGMHALLSCDGIEYRLWSARRICPGEQVVSILPYGDSAMSAAQAALAFWRHVAGGRAQRAHRDRRLERGVLALRALDGHTEGASYRALAEALFGPQRVSAYAWKTSSIRDATIRLVRTGAALVAGEYRRFLRLRADA